MAEHRLHAGVGAKAGPLHFLGTNDRDLVRILQADVAALAGEIGERNTRRYENLERAAAFVRESFEAAGCSVHQHRYRADGQDCQNLIVEMEGIGDADQVVVVGAHYDSVRGAPGANDNASGVAALLALARRLAGSRLNRTIRFAAFVNEEPPYIRTQQMGSLVYAQACRARKDNIVAMLSLETIGCFPSYDPPPGVSRAAQLLKPVQGNFLALVSNVRSRWLGRRVAAGFRRASRLPVRTFALPGFLPGVRSSDHWAFWQCGYPAVMVTDTAPFRYPFYHTRYDTPDKISYRALADVVHGLRAAVIGLAVGDRP